MGNTDKLIDDALNLDKKLASQIGDDVSVIFNHDYLFKEARRVNASLIDRIAALTADNEALKAEAGRLGEVVRETSDPDFLYGAMDNVSDMDVSIEDFANAASRAIRAYADYSLLAKQGSAK